MVSVQELDFNYKKFLDKSTLLFGVSKTGKSFVMVDILFQLQPYIDQIIVVSPMDKQNHTYDTGLVPTPCIHYTITPQLLEDIWERQLALSAVYSRANKPEILMKLFDRINNETTKSVVNSINEKLKTHRRELESSDDATAKSKISEMEEECKKLITMIYKHSINKCRSQLQNEKLSKEEEYTLKYLNVNPKLVLIFDDCTDELKRLKKNQIIEKIFYQGRWNNITIMMACHTDKAVNPEIKKNAFVTIFTEPASARAYFRRDSFNPDKETNAQTTALVKSVFNPAAKYQKLAYIREEDKYFKFTATKHSNFRFGSAALWDFCDRVKASENAPVNNNRFMGNFE